jgi:ABC-type amino acid transport system permease subunit
MDFLADVHSPALLRDALLAIEISVVSMLAGLLLGLGLTLLRLPRFGVLRSGA